MSKVITVTNPRGRKITFSEDEHKYHDEKGKLYRSTTHIIHSLFPEFPKDMMAYLTARKRIMKEEGYENKEDVPKWQCMQLKQKVLKEWDENRDSACDLGTEVHRYAECKLEEIPFDMEWSAERQTKMGKVLDKFIPQMLEQYEYVESEKIIFCPKIRLAGTVDLIMRNRKNGKPCIFDWKTNKEIRQKDSYGKTGLLFLEHLPNCNYFQYALQLSVYKKILHDEGYGDFSDCELGLFHINTRKVQGYQLPSMDWEVEEIWKYTKNLKES